MVFIIITILLGLYFGLTKKTEYYLYLFFFSIFYLPLLLNWTNMYQYQGFIPIFLIGLLLVLNANRLLRHHFFSTFSIKLIVIIFSLTCFIFINSIINNYDTIKGVLFFRNFFWSAILFSIIISVGRIKVDISKILLFIFVTQVVLVIIQFIGGSSVSKLFLLLEYEKDGKMQSATSDSVIKYTVDAGTFLLVGSLGKITKLANFLSLFVTYWTGHALLNYSKLRLFDWAVVIISLSIIALTGVRAPLITALIGFALSFYIFSHTGKKKLILVFTVLFMILILPGLIQIGNTVAAERLNYGDSYQRIMSIFSVLGNLDSLDSSNSYTLGRSLYLLGYLNAESFFFGTGVYTNNPLGYEGISSITDCMIAFIIVEYGIFAFILCTLPYGLTIHYARQYANKEQYKMIFILFIVVFLQTIVDQGMFDMLTSYSFYLICALSLKTYSQKIQIKKLLLINTGKKNLDVSGGVSNPECCD